MIHLLALALAAAMPASPAADPQIPATQKAARHRAALEHAAAVLGEPRYRYCHDPSYPLYPHEARWCDLVGDANARCPALPRACKGDRLAPTDQRDHRAPAAEHDDEPGSPTALDASMGGLAMILFGLVVAGAIGMLGYAVVRGIRGSPADDPASERDAPAAGDAGVAAGRGPIETDCDRLLARARAHADGGQFDRALDCLYAALLRRLEGDGLIRVRPWRTNGDYLRDLAERPDLRSGVRAIVREIERVQFGAGHASPELFGALLARIAPMVSRVLVALACALLIGGAASCSWSRRGAWDDSPSGSGAIFDLLQRSGITARQRLAPLTHLGSADTDVIVLLPGARVDAAEWQALLGWVRAGNHVIVANRPSNLPAELSVQLRREQATTTEPLRVVEAVSQQFPGFRLAVPPGASLELGSQSRKEVFPLLVRGDAIYAACSNLGKGQVITLADGHLLTNAALAVADDPAFLVALFDFIGPRVELVDESTGAASPSPAASVRRGRLLPLTLQLALLLVLFFLYKGAAFGPLRDPRDRSRRGFVEHARALGMQYERARAARHALALYATYAFERLRRLAQERGRGLHSLAEAIARRTGRSLGAVMRILVEAKEAREAPLAQGSAAQQGEDLALIRELGQLMQEIRRDP